MYNGVDETWKKCISSYSLRTFKEAKDVLSPVESNHLWAWFGKPWNPNKILITVMMKKVRFSYPGSLDNGQKNRELNYDNLFDHSQSEQHHPQ